MAGASGDAVIRGGKLLTAEQNVRLAVLDNMAREDVIAHIVKALRARESSRRYRAGKAKAKTRAQPL